MSDDDVNYRKTKFRGTKIIQMLKTHMQTSETTVKQCVGEEFANKTLCRVMIQADAFGQTEREERVKC